jgi:opacity protein-like surface antigen
MRLKVLLLCGALATFMVFPATASADWIFTPYLGATFGSDVPDLDEDAGDNVGEKLSFGGSLAYMGANIIGFEVDLGYTPEFFELDEDLDSFDSNVVTLMANAIVGAPIGVAPGVRPYASGGVGLVRSHVTDAGDLFDASNSDFGVNIGGGVMGFFNDNVGVRGDIRYFRALVDEEEDEEFDISFGDFDFWRGSVGVTFRF